jgi:putative sterol carrier protein
MARFPSAEWAELFREALNSNAEYAEAARAWEGDLLFFVTADDAAPKGEGIHLDLFHGSCRSARYTDDPSTVSSEFTYSGKRQDWARLLRGDLDPVQALLKGTFRIGGNLPKVMRFTRAATLLASTAASVPIEF